MTTVAVGSCKGGVGKTTLAVNLASFLQHAGHDVSLVDCGGGGDVHRWVQRRQRKGLGTVRCHTWSQAGMSAVGSANAANEVAYTIIDAGPQHEYVAPLLAQVDLWLVPTSPIFPDFGSTLKLFDLWRDARDTQRTPGLFAAVITPISPNERDLEWGARRKMSFARPEMLVLNQSLTRHKAWDATFSGQAVHELPAAIGGKAATEFIAMVGQFFAHGLATLSAPPRAFINVNGRPANAALQ